MQIHILVGSVHGTAMRVAQTVSLCAEDLSVQVHIHPMDTLQADIFEQPGFFIICTSTTGNGDIPNNAHSFYHALEINARYLGHVKYGLIALGDSSYGETFCAGGKQFDARLQDLGAQRIEPMLLLDACDSTEPEITAAAWFEDWIHHLLTHNTPRQ